MGKYNIRSFDKQYVDFCLWQIQKDIANELAEANRLKRKELELRIVLDEVRTTPEALDKFLELLGDQAI